MQKAQAGPSWLVSWLSFGPPSPAIIVQWDSGKDSVTLPLQDADILPERFLEYFSGMFWIVVFLELPVVAELELLCRFLQVFIEDLDVFLLSQEFLDPDGTPCALGRQAPPYHDVCMIPLHDVCITCMICVWRKKGESYHPMSTMPPVRHGAGNIMLCGCFSFRTSGAARGGG